MSLQFENVSKRFIGSDALVLESVSFQVSYGECVSLLGSNGSGKSTILRLACGLLTPDEGTVRFDGRDPARAGVSRGEMAVALEAGICLYARLTPRENFKYFSALYRNTDTLRVERFEVLCERFGIAAYMDRPLQKLSKGTQQKVSLINALVRPSRLQILDEPTLGLDEQSVAVLRDLLGEHIQAGGSCLLATHERELAVSLGRLVQVANLTSGHTRGVQLGGASAAI